MPRTWLPWLLVLLFVLGAGEGLATLLARQDAVGMSELIRLLGRLVASGWVVFGMIRWRQVRWVDRATRVVIMSIIAVLAEQVFSVLGLDRLARWVVSIYLMGLLFVGSVLVLNLILGLNFRVMAVAKTVVDEALKSRMAISFIVALFIFLPSIQIFTVATETRVEYQVKSFLVFSLMLTGTILGFLTILQGAWSVSQEREDKQIFLTLTKPIGRMQYLIGKWLGLVLLNAALIFVASVGIFLFTMELKVTDDYFDEADKAAVDQRVLIARTKVDPVPNNPSRNLAPMVIAEAQRILEDTDLKTISDISPKHREDIIKSEQKRWLSIGGLGVSDGEPSSKEYLFVDIPPMWNPRTVRGAIQRHFEATSTADQLDAIQEIRDGFVQLHESVDKRKAMEWVDQIEAGQGGHPALSEFIREKLPADTIQLQIKPRANGEAEDNRVRLVISAQGVLVAPPHYDPNLFASSDFEAQRRNNSWSFAENVFSVVSIPSWYVTDKRELVLRIDNVTATGSSISFHKDRGLVLLYRSGGFTPNFVKAVCLLWIRLMFVAMVAVGAGSFLSFPVAGLLTFVVFFAAVGTSYLTESIQGYSAINVTYDSMGERVGHAIGSTAGKVSEGDFYETFKIMISAIGQIWLFIVPDLSQAAGTTMIRDGVVIPNRLVLGALARIALVSTSVACLIGWLVFRRREVARVIV